MTEAKYKLTVGDQIDHVPEGYVVECKATIENIRLPNNIELGVFTVKDMENLSKVISILSDNVGPEKRTNVNQFMSQFIEWPLDINSGIPAYLEGIAVVYHDGNGNKFNMVQEVENELSYS